MRRLRTNDDGASLVEVLVVMVVAAVIMSSLVSVVVAVNRTSGLVTGLSADANGARLALDRTTQLVRTATNQPTDASTPLPAFDHAAEDEIVFYSNYGVDVLAGEGPHRIRLHVDDGELIEEIVPAAGSYPTFTWTGTPQTRVVARGLQDDDVFTFFVSGRDQTPPVAFEQVTPPVAGLAEVDRRGLVAIGIDVTVRGEEGRGDTPLAAASRVRLPGVLQ